MRLLTVPNWSFGRDRDLLRRFEAILQDSEVEVHYLQADLDHNRTVSAFSGSPGELVEALGQLCEEAFDRIDLNRHMGVHPRIGALDVCPFVLLTGQDSAEAIETAQATAVVFAEVLSREFRVPVFLYERSERGRHESDLPSLRRGGFGSLLERDLAPDFGPAKAHRQLGVSVVGVRDPLIAMNVNLATPESALAKELAARIRVLRAEGEMRFLGVRALGLPLVSRDLSQVSMNLTLPSLTPVDPIVEWIQEEAAKTRIPVAETELIGVIRREDVVGATRLPIRPEQIV